MTNKTKQTAVEWLVDQLECFGNKHELTISWTTLDDLVEQAKEMERKQRINDINFGHSIPSSVNINYEAYFKLESNENRNERNDSKHN